MTRTHGDRGLGREEIMVGRVQDLPGWLAERTAQMTTAPTPFLPAGAGAFVTWWQGRRGIVVKKMGGSRTRPELIGQVTDSPIKGVLAKVGLVENNW